MEDAKYESLPGDEEHVEMKKQKNRKTSRSRSPKRKDHDAASKSESEVRLMMEEKTGDHLFNRKVESYVKKVLDCGAHAQAKFVSAGIWGVLRGKPYKIERVMSTKLADPSTILRTAVGLIEIVLRSECSKIQDDTSNDDLQSILNRLEGDIGFTMKVTGVRKKRYAEQWLEAIRKLRNECAHDVDIVAKDAKKLIDTVIVAFRQGKNDDFNILVDDLETCVDVIEAWERIQGQLDDLPLLVTKQSLGDFQANTDKTGYMLLYGIFVLMVVGFMLCATFCLGFAGKGREALIVDVSAGFFMCLGMSLLVGKLHFDEMDDATFFENLFMQIFIPSHSVLLQNRHVMTLTQFKEEIASLPDKQLTKKFGETESIGKKKAFSRIIKKSATSTHGKPKKSDDAVGLDLRHRNDFSDIIEMFRDLSKHLKSMKSTILKWRKKERCVQMCKILNQIIISSQYSNLSPHVIRQRSVRNHQIELQRYAAMAHRQTCGAVASAYSTLHIVAT
eukprot:g1543.t1